MIFSFLRAATFALYAAWSEMKTSSTLALASKAMTQGAMFLLVESIFVLLCAWIRRSTNAAEDNDRPNDVPIQPTSTVNTSSSTQDLLNVSIIQVRRPDLLLLVTQFTTLVLSVLGIVGSVKYYKSKSSSDSKIGEHLQRTSDAGFVVMIVVSALITTWWVCRVVAPHGNILARRREWLRAAVLYICMAALAAEEVTKTIDVFASPRWPRYTLLFVPELAVLVFLLFVNLSELFDFEDKKDVEKNFDSL
jgi:hypothetical protein